MNVHLGEPPDQLDILIDVLGAAHHVSSLLVTLLASQSWKHLMRGHWGLHIPGQIQKIMIIS